MVSLPPDVMANHPEWAGLVDVNGNIDPNSTPQAQANRQVQAGFSTPPPVTMPAQGPPAFVPVPQPYGGVGLPQSSAFGNMPLTAPGVPFPATPPVVNNGSPITAQWQANQNLIAKQQQDISLNKAVPLLQPLMTGATTDYLNAKQTNLGAQNAYLAEQMRANEQQRNAQVGIQAAKQNTGDITAVAQAQRERDNTDYRYRLAGLATPIDVKMPMGFTGQLPPGVRVQLQTLGDQLTAKAKDADAMEQFNLNAAKLYADQTGQAVTAADIAKGRVQLTLDMATAAAKLAGWDTQEASLAVKATGEPPYAGAVWDDTTSSWTDANTAAFNKAKAKKDQDFEMQGALGSIPAGTLMQMATMTDAEGNPSPTISMEQLRTGLIAGGMNPATAEFYVTQAAAQLAKAKGGTRAPPPPPPGSGFPTPAAAAPPNLGILGAPGQTVR